MTSQEFFQKPRTAAETLAFAANAPKWVTVLKTSKRTETREYRFPCGHRVVIRAAHEDFPK